MGKEVVLFKSEEKMSSGQAASLLRQIADKIEAGEIVLERGKKSVNLSIPSQLEVEIKAEKEIGKKKTTMKLEVELEWPLGGSKAAVGPMKIR
ncbi:MAG: amphi-Trp domain-containing protein [Desulfofustis sp.]|nr:amphi-Trp domain-containing protein [Desulfofustis sp.]NNK13741.1 amphi-Trp domain-containing protein [Desulfofustis sp.]RZW25392.1 MAG: amphi-Trp domain-containing protein [Desulfobulbaceae bacterium]